MATKEEIREGISTFLNKVGSGLLTEELDDFLTYLDSQGVVLKVERELPCCEYGTMPTMSEDYNIGYKKGFGTGAIDMLSAVFRAGYSAVEPLV